MRSFDNHLRAISLRKPQPSISKINMKITFIEISQGPMNSFPISNPEFRFQYSLQVDSGHSYLIYSAVSDGQKVYEIYISQTRVSRCHKGQMTLQITGHAERIIHPLYLIEIYIRISVHETQIHDTGLLQMSTCTNPIYLYINMFEVLY